MNKSLIVFAFLCSLFATNMASAKKSFPSSKDISMYETGIFQGQSGVKVTAQYNTSFSILVDYFRSDLPHLHSKNYPKDEGWLLGNQNVFWGVGASRYYDEYTVLSRMGYEYNYVFLSARASLQANYRIRPQQIDPRLVLETGLTLFGFIQAHVGYGFSFEKKSNPYLSPFQLNASCNIFR